MTLQLIPKPGQRIECVLMAGDPDPIPPGSRGTVLSTQGVGELVHVNIAWDNGRSLCLLHTIDKWKVLSRG